MARESRFDHLVVTAADLDTGVAYVHGQIGVLPSAGGKHPRMGTHNRLLKLGDQAFLEVIAPDPDATSPARPRWFGLDALARGQPPRLATWVVRTPSIGGAVVACPPEVGEIEPISRGELNWLITIPPDGALPLDGVIPALIEWGVDTHPAINLPDSGCTLLALELYHPEGERIRSMLDSVGFSGPVTVCDSQLEGGGLVAHMATPSGNCRLDGRF